MYHVSASIRIEIIFGTCLIEMSVCKLDNILKHAQFEFELIVKTKRIKKVIHNSCYYMDNIYLNYSIYSN
jgi:hypothetical protein